MAECLKYVIDPEVGINIVDLGLVYDIELAPPHISVSITMTTPACPLSGHISNHAYAVLERIRGVEDVDVDIVWQPPWSPQMMDPEVGARHFGRHFRR